MKTLSPKERVLKLLQRRNARMKFKEIRSLAKLSNKETELAIAEIRKTRNDLVYAKFDKTFYFSDVVTHYSNQTDLSQVMPLEGQFGLISDTHLGSIGERLDLMKWAYDVFAARGIKQVFHQGDVTDGWDEYRGHINFVKIYGSAPQAIRVIKSYPKREGITTYMIGGNHDDDNNRRSLDRLSMVTNGVDYEGKHYDGRSDIVYLGQYAHRIILPQEVTMEMLHPRGGASYAVSYKQQKRSEAMEKNLRPDIQVSGHYHTFNYIWLQNTHFVACPGMQDETEFFKRLGLPRGMGFVIIHYKIEDARLKSFGPELFMTR
jgi:predicted phosphodiesterase